MQFWARCWKRNGKNRPCVILQNDIGNLKSPNIIVAPITHDLPTFPTMAPIATRTDSNGAVYLDGCVNTSNILCSSKARLGNYIDVLSPTEMKEVDKCLARALDVMHYYSALEKRHNSKLEYIERIKKDRNEAQDSLKEVFLLIGVDNMEDARKELSNMQKIIDN